MALTNVPTAALKINYKDASGSTGHTLIHVPFDTLAAAALAAGEAIAATIVAITGCSVTGFDLTYGFVEDAPATPDAGSRVENKGVFTWLCDNGLKSTFTVPGIIDSVLNVDGSIDRTDALIIALVAVVEDVGAIFASVSGADIVTLASAYQRFNGSTKRQLPSNR